MITSHFNPLPIQFHSTNLIDSLESIIYLSNFNFIAFRYESEPSPLRIFRSYVRSIILNDAIVVQIAYIKRLIVFFFFFFRCTWSHVHKYEDPLEARHALYFLCRRFNLIGGYVRRVIYRISIRFAIRL